MQNPFDVYQKNQKIDARRSEQKVPPVRVAKTRKRVTQIKNKNGENPWKVILGCAFGLSFSLYVMVYTDDVIAFLNSIDVGFSTSQAADVENNAEEEQNEPEKKTALPVGNVSQLKSDADHLTMKNASVYNALKDKRRELEKKERRLAQLEEELQIQKIEIEKQLKEMQEMRANISQKLDRKVAADQESIDKLVGVYANMKPQNAAVILSSVDEELAIKVLGKMKKQSAASILNYVDPKKAQILSEKFSGLKN